MRTTLSAPEFSEAERACAIGVQHDLGASSWTTTLGTLVDLNEGDAEKAVRSALRAILDGSNAAIVRGPFSTFTLSRLADSAAY